MTIDRPDSAGLRRRAPLIGPLTFDAREQALGTALRRHVLIRDACLAPSSLIAEKLDALDHLDAAPEEHATGTTVLHQMQRVRHEIVDVGSLIPADRRRLVLLDLLTSLPTTVSGHGWSRSPADLVTEAAGGIGYGRGDVRRLVRAVVAARQGLPSVSVGPSPARALAETLRSVSTCGPGTGIAHAVLLLTGEQATPASRCGAVLLDPAPGDLRYLGSIVARHDLASFVDDLATVQVAAEVDATVRSYVCALLPDLAAELDSLEVCDGEREAVDVAADLAAALARRIARGRRRRPTLRRF